MVGLLIENHWPTPANALLWSLFVKTGKTGHWTEIVLRSLSDRAYGRWFWTSAQGVGRKAYYDTQTPTLVSVSWGGGASYQAAGLVDSSDSVTWDGVAGWDGMTYVRINHMVGPAFGTGTVQVDYTGTGSWTTLGTVNCLAGAVSTIRNWAEFPLSTALTSSSKIRVVGVADGNSPILRSLVLRNDSPPTSTSGVALDPSTTVSDTVASEAIWNVTYDSDTVYGGGFYHNSISTDMHQDLTALSILATTGSYTPAAGYKPGILTLQQDFDVFHPASDDSFPQIGTTSQLWTAITNGLRFTETWTLSEAVDIDHGYFGGIHTTAALAATTYAWTNGGYRALFPSVGSVAGTAGDTIMGDYGVGLPCPAQSELLEISKNSTTYATDNIYSSDTLLRFLVSPSLSAIATDVLTADFKWTWDDFLWAGGGNQITSIGGLGAVQVSPRRAVQER